MCARKLEPMNASGTGAIFATTDWNVVLTAQSAPSPQAEQALEELCCTYWRPLYAYVRGRGYGPEEAQDLTQEFFSRLVAKQYLESVDLEKGRFRSYLLACIEHFLANQWDKDRAIKRGGRVRFLSWDGGIAETQIEQDLNLALNPERLFARRWALTLLDLVEARLQAYYAASGKQRLYDQLGPYLSKDPGRPTYADAARQLGMSTEAVGKAVRRMRHRYGLWLREEISRTVCDPGEIDDELRFLRRALAG